jgi:hypothetical protein
VPYREGYSGRSSRRFHHFGFRHRHFPHTHFGFHYGYFGYPFYYSGHYGPYPYGYYPRVAWYDYRYSENFGAVDLNVRPKKAEVYLNGQRIGQAGDFDGFPSELWLEEGSYDLVFYRPGYETLHRRVTIYPGLVIDLDEDMRPGEAVAPEEILPPPEAEAGEDGVATRIGTEPGRLHFAIEPVEASIYLDGRFLGTASELSALRAGLMVSPGKHLLAVVYPGFHQREVELEVGAGEDLDVDLDLERLR